MKLPEIPADHHTTYMKLAIKEAWRAYNKGEIPVGAVIVSHKGEVLSNAHNETIARNDPTGHAEMIALRKAAKLIENYRLINTKIYVTIEPCIMCAGALIHARVEEVIFGVPDPKWGGLQSLYHFGEDGRLNHRIKVTSGILGSECEEIIQRFFKEKRKLLKGSSSSVGPFTDNP
jgi:tRNA(adenine34) deaminase